MILEAAIRMREIGKAYVLQRRQLSSMSLVQDEGLETEDWEQSFHDWPRTQKRVNKEIRVPVYYYWQEDLIERL
jgi:hypothetical protein